MTDGNRGPALDTTDTSLSLLDAIEELDGATLSELADHRDLAVSTVHDHLRTLCHHQYVVRHGDRYELGLRFLQKAEYARHRDPRYAIARRAAHDLAAEVGEDVSFTVEEHGRAIIVHSESPTPAAAGFHLGKSPYLHCSSGGKAIMARLPPERIEAILDRWGLPAVTDRTITDPDELFAELDRIRERGYATTDGEAMVGLKAVGMAVEGPEGVFGALDVSGPPYRLPAVETLADHLESAVADLAAEIADVNPYAGRSATDHYDSRLMVEDR